MRWLISTLLWSVAFWYLLPFIVLVFCVAALGRLHYHVYTHPKRTKTDENPFEFWKPVFKQAGVFWRTIGRIWHGYEVDGLENIPREGAALLIFYHGAIPLDVWYLGSEIYLETGRVLLAVSDNFLLKLPGTKMLAEAMQLISGPVERCVEKLSAGNLLTISPGGIRESQFSDENYSLFWGTRLGFAKVALQAKVPIIPFFTENHRETFRCPWICQKLLRSLYERCRWPVVPFYGGFPVKMITHVGKPIPYDSSLTPEELAQKTKVALEELICKHQTLPGSIFNGLKMRFTSKSLETQK